MGRKGKLTDSMIDKLHNYFGIAIRTNPGNIAAMKNALLASLFHCSSSSNNKWHTYCPEGENSWCGFMRDKAKGTNDYKHGNGLLVPVVTAINPSTTGLVMMNYWSNALTVKCKIKTSH